MTTTRAPLRSLGAVMKTEFRVEPGTPPEFATYLRTIASDRLVALAAWADVREKAVRLRRDSQVHVELYKPEIITANVEGDHGTYFTTVQRLGAYPGGPSRLRESSISGWSCECFLPGTLVTMSDFSMKPIEEIQIGELVRTGSGRVRRVTRTMSRNYKGEIYGVRVSGSHEVERVWATEEHPWYSGGEYVESKNLTTNHYLQSPAYQNDFEKNTVFDMGEYVQDGFVEFDSEWVSWIRSKRRITRVLTKKSVTGDVGTIQTYNSTVGRPIKRFVEFDRELAYLVGLFVGDGNFNNGDELDFTFGSNEENLADEVLRIAFRKFGLTGSKILKGNVWEVKVYSTPLQNLMRSLTGEYARHKKLSEVIFSQSVEVLEGLVQGYVDSDGSISGNSRVISSVNRTLISQMEAILHRLGYLISIEYNTPEQQATIFEGQTPISVENVLGCYSLVFRKKGIPYYRKMDSEGNQWTRIKDIKIEEYDGLVYNLEVEEDHTYQVHGLHVHNCEWGQWAWVRKRSFVGRMCFVPGTLVTMSDGTLKKIEEIQIGDSVRSHTGESRRVVDTIQNYYNGTLYGVRARGHQRVWSTKEHPWYVQHGRGAVKCEKCWDRGSDPGYCNSRSHQKVYSPQWIEAQDLTEDFWVTKTAPRVVERETIFDLSEFCESFVQEGDSIRITHPRTRVTKRGSFSWNMAYGNKVNRYVKMDGDLAYLMGLWVGDGGLGGPYETDSSLVWSFGIHEQKLVDETVRILREKFGVNPRVAFEGNSIQNVSIGSVILKEFFKRHCGIGVRRKKLSEEVLSSSPSVLLELLRGWYDSDAGYSVNRSLVHQMEQIAIRNGLPMSITVTSAEKNQGTTDIYHMNCTWPKKTGRWFNNFVEDGTQYVKIDSIETKQYEGSVLNLSVEVDETYQVYGMNVHNCSHALALTYEMQSRDHASRRDRGKPVRVRQGPSTPGGTGQRTRMTLSSANRNAWARQPNGAWSFVTDDPYFPTASIMKVRSGYRAEVWPDGLSTFSLSVGTFRNSEGARRAVARVINSAVRPNYQDMGNQDWSDDEWDHFIGVGQHPETRNVNPDYPSYSPTHSPSSGLESEDFLEGVQPGSTLRMTYHDLLNQTHHQDNVIFHGITGEGDNRRAHFTSEQNPNEKPWQAYQYAADPDELDDMSSEEDGDEDDNPALRDYREGLEDFRQNYDHYYNGQPRWSYGSGADPLEGEVIAGPHPGYRPPALQHEGSLKLTNFGDWRDPSITHPLTRTADDQPDHKMYGRPVTEEDEEKDEGVRKEVVAGKFWRDWPTSRRPVQTVSSPYLSDYEHGYDAMGNSLAPEDSIDDMVTDGRDSDEVTGMMDPQAALSDGGRVDTSTAPQVTSSFWSFAEEESDQILGVDTENLQEDPQTETQIVEDNLDHGDAPFIDDYQRSSDAQDFWGGEEFTSQASTTPQGNHPLAHRPKHGGTGIQRQGGKDYSIAEQQALVDEPGVARNAGQLRLEGTHYAQDTEESPLDFF